MMHPSDNLVPFLDELERFERHVLRRFELLEKRLDERFDRLEECLPPPSESPPSTVDRLYR